MWPRPWRRRPQTNADLIIATLATVEATMVAAASALVVTVGPVAVTAISLTYGQNVNLRLLSWIPARTMANTITIDRTSLQA